MTTASPNVILLSIDALRADHCSCYGYERETTPNLDRFAEDNVHFLNAYSASAHTREAVPAMLTGLYPNECVDEGYALASQTGASWLRDTEYVAGAFHSNPYVSGAYGFDRNFDQFDDDLYLGQHKLLALVQRAFDKIRNRHYARAETINQRALSWLDSVNDPAFLWNHYMDPHGPYCPPEEYQSYHHERVGMKRAQQMYKRAAVTDPESITDAERQEMVNLYDDEIRYVDEQIGAFLDTLDRRGLLAESLVIITADHGDAFGEHDYYGHPRRLDDVLLQIPLLVSTPRGANESLSVLASLLDVIPTLLDICGISGGELPGTSLFEILDDPADHRNRRVISSVRGQDEDNDLRWFRIHGPSDGYHVEQDIKSGEIVSEMGDDGPAKQTLLKFCRQRTEQFGDRGADTDADGEIERRLEALGYK